MRLAKDEIHDCFEGIQNVLTNARRFLRSWEITDYEDTARQATESMGGFRH